MSAPVPSILDATSTVFSPWFKDRATWGTWFAFLAVLFGLQLTPQQLATFQRHTGRTTPRAGGYLEATLVIGRRGGKSLILALIAAYLAVFFDWKPYLTGGERATIIVVAADRRQARAIFRYLKEMLSIPPLAGLIERETAEELDLSNGVTVEITAANFKTIRSRSIVAALLDELAYWPIDEDMANPDAEIVAAIRPAMATIPGAMLLKASSPYAMRGELWQDFNRYYGRDDADVLVWKARTIEMNPTVSATFIAKEFERDSAKAAAEYNAEFRSDVANYVERAIIEAAVDQGIVSRPRHSNAVHVAFADAASGLGGPNSGDKFALAIGHREAEMLIIDFVREWRPPFNVAMVISELAEVCRSYGITELTSDRFAAGFMVAELQRNSMTHRASEWDKSALYANCLPAFTSGKVRLTDYRPAVDQFCTLERRPSSGGRDRIDGRQGRSEDAANVIAGTISLLMKPQSFAENWIEFYRRLSEKAAPPLGSEPVRARVHVPAELDISTIYGISGNAYAVEISSDGRRTAVMSLDDAKALVCSPFPSPSWREVNPHL